MNILELAQQSPRSALQILLPAIAADPNDLFALRVAGLASRLDGKYEQAIGFLNRALHLENDPEALNQMGLCYRSLEQFDNARQYFMMSLAMSPSAMSWTNCGKIYLEMMQLDRAIACFQKAQEFDCQYAPAHLDAAFAYGLTGDWKRCFQEYEWRFAYYDDLRALREKYGKSWAGEPLVGKRLLVYGDQGLGDWIQFSRYVRRLPDNTILHCPATLCRLLAKLGRKVVAAEEVPPPHDYCCSVMSLPHLLKAYDIDGKPYIEMNLRPSKSIGVAWTSKAHPWRGVDPQFFRLIADKSRKEFVSVQHRVDGLFPDITAECQDFLDTAEKFSELGLVITVDTVYLHLAGAIGLPCWVLLWYYPHWIWNVQGQKWYNSVTTFQQHAWGKWEAVETAVVEKLKEWQ